MIALAEPQVAIAPRYRFDADKHIHLLDERPLHGTSTICNIIAKPLVWWASGKAVYPLGWRRKSEFKVAARLQAAADGQAAIAAMTPRQYMDFLEAECYRAHNTEKEETAVEGTATHAELEDYVKDCIYEHAGDPQPPSENACEALSLFATWSLANVRTFLWSEAHCYSESMWTGGICDCGAILMDGEAAVIDFKRSKEAYYSQFLQCGGYCSQIKESGLVDSSGGRIALGRTIRFGALVVFPSRAGEVFVRRNVAEFAAAFRGAVANHKLKLEFEKAA